MGIAERKERERQKRRAEIVKAAEQVFFTRGFEKSTMDDIAERAELSKGTLYLYFKSKEELLFLIQFRTFDSLCDQLKEIIASETDPQSCLHRMIRMHFDYFIRNMSDLKICSREIESLEGAFYKKVATKRKEYFDLTQSIFEKMTDQCGASSADSRLAALYLFGTLNWIYQWYKPGRYPDAEELASQLAGIYLQGFPQMEKKRS